MGKIIAAIIVLLILGGIVWALIWVAKPVQVDKNLPDSTQAESIYLDTSSANSNTGTN